MNGPAGARGLLLVAVGDARLAVRGGQVGEVARVESAAAVPCDDPAVLGVAVHRDRLVPLLDLRRRLGAGTAGPGPWLCVFVRTAAGQVALPIDTVLGFGPAGSVRLPDDVIFVDLAALDGGEGRHGAPAAH